MFILCRSLASVQLVGSTEGYLLPLHVCRSGLAFLWQEGAQARSPGCGARRRAPWEPGYVPLDPISAVWYCCYCTATLICNNHYTNVRALVLNCERNVFSDGEEHLKEDLSNLEQLLSKPSWIEKQFGS